MESVQELLTLGAIAAVMLQHDTEVLATTTPEEGGDRQ